MAEEQEKKKLAKETDQSEDKDKNTEDAPQEAPVDESDDKVSK